MKTSRFIFLLLVVLVTVTAQAQTQEWCGSARFVKEQLQSDPEFAQQYADFLEMVKQMPDNPSGRATDATLPIVYVPVVFHIVHNGDAIGTGENISDEKIYTQIEALNEQFNAADPHINEVPVPFQSLVGNARIKFCLALFDPAGNPTTGIVRHQYSQATWDSSSTIDRVLKPATIWDNKKYLNIWSVRMGGYIQAQGILAYATFPGGNATRDGVVARYNTIGTGAGLMSGYAEGKTVGHEVGHWLALFHVWGDDDGKCAGQTGAGSDYNSDTPDQADLNFGCPTFPHVTCNNGPNGDMFMNYMDYTYDACRNMFTVGQITKMRSILDGTRSQIKTSSSKCFYNIDAAIVNVLQPSVAVCTLNFRPVVVVKNTGVAAITSGRFYYQIDGGAVQIHDWTANIASQDEVGILLPEQTVSAGGTHTIDVTLASPNGLPNDDFAGNDTWASSFTATAGPIGTTAPFSEDFETSFPQNNWDVSNPNSDVTWDINYNAGGFGSSSASTSIDNFSYTTNPNKKKDALITDSYDFTNIANPQLNFDVAYARYDASRSDSLNVYYSLNCGASWTKIWNQRGADLATAPDQTTLFVPTASQWKTVSNTLTNLGGQNKVSFKFENVTGWGNMMYLDNINVQNVNTGIKEVEKVDVQIFPNPSGSLTAIRLPFNHKFTQMRLLNNIGQAVYETNINDNSLIFSTDNFPNGLYLVQLTGNSITQTEKLLLIK